MILITGATGNVGRPLLDLLTAQGAAVRAVTRDPAGAGLPAGTDVVRGDPSRPETLADALEGVAALFLNPVAVQDAYRDLLALARERGVRRVVALSALNVDDDLADQPSRLRGASHQEVEEALDASGMAWTALRSGWYASNTLRMWAGQLRAGDTVRGPYAESAWAPVHETDIAGVAARALLTDELLGRRPVLTGPRSLTFREMVEILGAAWGRLLRFEEIPPHVAKEAMLRGGFPHSEAFIDGMLALQAKTVGRPALVTDEVETILGRPALTFAAWALDHKDAFLGAALPARA
ncbi:NAD(P)H-binding protein [Streptomyces litchfieldiae]|uniref:NAD(P)H-binding protein n=1 Tax=Streptomyces litchfieldiae TaxID=3075543 RepID=A0ABU2MWB4_9ACTN|nr:NAD(P)H-binding protein [Streptomyces sp. DSM 44938]MDT0345885.1 NAD(P)H-binding protein [Streptomyces sp. DSM 44938]